MSVEPLHGCNVHGACSEPRCPKCPELMGLAGYLRGTKIFVVLDEEDQPIYCASHASMCHEHVNDAINKYGLFYAAKWRVRSAIVAAKPEGR